MQVNYMRIAIYALTFLTYAYSGYGSNIIHNLRDAIIAAEAVFGDVFKNLIHVARKFKTVHSVFDAAVEETCVFKCPGGKKKQVEIKFSLDFNILLKISCLVFREFLIDFFFKFKVECILRFEINVF